MRLNRTFFYILLGWVAVLGMTSCADEKIAIPESLIPQVITVEEFNTGNYNGKLVQIENVQFEEPEGTKFNGTTSNANGNKTVSDCAGNTFLLFTSTSRDFANSTLPRGNGTITGVGASFNGTVQLELRTIKDIFGLQGERCDPTAGIAAISVAEFNSGKYEGKIVKLENVQFDEADGTKFNGTTSNGNGSKRLIDCAGNALVVFTSTSSDISDELLPTGNGTILGVGSSFRGTAQLTVRSLDDVKAMTANKCTVNLGANATLKTIKEMRDMYKGSAIDISDDFKIKGVITSDKDAGNITSRNIFIQDATGGIAVRFTGDNTFALGDEVEIALKGTQLTEFSGLTQFGNVPNSSATKVADGTLPTPETITIDQLKTGDYQGKLIQLEGVTFTGKGTFADNSGDQPIAKDGKETIFRTRSDANFAGDALPTAAVTVVGHAAVFNNTIQVLPRNKNDIK
ncbi:DUF5689 domain-containing protein [uncultured Microscilla sp.]|uniref:DUF5689 domain-containing protein n=1 Tax=uncultured Microscilla sp. TaxID=432653 RepID=UPI00262EB59A|nr:DUF5689 domain-containing protein [uncultured Microscilla sp.]